MAPPQLEVAAVSCLDLQCRAAVGAKGWRLRCCQNPVQGVTIPTTLTGTVTTGGATPVEGVTVTVQGKPGISDIDGKYTITDLVPSSTRSPLLGTQGLVGAAGIPALTIIRSRTPRLPSVDMQQAR